MGNYFKAKTADDLWLKLVKVLREKSLLNDLTRSRAGNNIELLHTFFSIENSRDRWIISRFPPLNPAFSIVELVWILNGRNDSAFLNYWNSKLPFFAGRGYKYYGAYGYRLRKNFGIDQINRAYQALKYNPDSRQIVLQIWDPKIDLPGKNGKERNPDIPCNISSLLKVRNGKLEWTQILRSNDVFLGLPYNILQFTSLQEILAGWLNLEVGSYNQLSDSLHLYTHDLVHFNKPIKQHKVINTDSLAIEKKHSEKLFKELALKIETIINAKRSIAKIESVLLWKAPLAYKNLLYVLVAEAMRKHKFTSKAVEIIQQCNNPILIKMWDNWFKRTSK